VVAPVLGEGCGLFFRGHGVSPGVIVARRKWRDWKVPS
jgi:hypothetical protein